MTETNTWVTEQRNEHTLHIDQVSTVEMLTLMSDEDSLVPLAVRKQIPQIAAATEEACRRLRQHGRLFYAGAGTSGRLAALDAAEWPPTFGVDGSIVQVIVAGGDVALRTASEGNEDDRAAGETQARSRICAADMVVGLSASGHTPFTLGVMVEARRRGAYVVGVTCNPRSQMEAVADLVIAPIVGPEILQGSTRLKAGTAQKLVLNMLSTAIMTRMGNVYSNLMVGVRPKNSKLRARAIRIIAQATGCSLHTAESVLAQADDDVKVAIVMLGAACDRENARERLTRYKGVIADALSADER